MGGWELVQVVEFENVEFLILSSLKYKVPAWVTFVFVLVLSQKFRMKRLEKEKICQESCTWV